MNICIFTVRKTAVKQIASAVKWQQTEAGFFFGSQLSTFPVVGSLSTAESAKGHALLELWGNTPNKIETYLGIRERRIYQW